MNSVVIGNATLILGDCTKIIKNIQDKSISLIHTDPPYLIHSNGNMGKMMQSKARKSYDKIIEAQISDGFDCNFLFRQFQRICKFINYQIWCSKKQYIDYLIMAKNNQWNWQDICLYRNNALPNVRGKYQDKDYCVHLWKGRTLTGTYHQKVTDYHYTIGGKKQWNHPALKPLQPCYNLIHIGSDENDIVFDPFMGSGTTGVACIKSKRKFIGVEKNQAFFQMAVQRLKKQYQSVDGVKQLHQEQLF